MGKKLVFEQLKSYLNRNHLDFITEAQTRIDLGINTPEIGFYLDDLVTLGFLEKTTKDLFNVLLKVPPSLTLNDMKIYAVFVRNGGKVELEGEESGIVTNIYSVFSKPRRGTKKPKQEAKPQVIPPHLQHTQLVQKALRKAQLTIDLDFNVKGEIIGASITNRT